MEEWAKVQKRNRSEGKAMPIMKVAATEVWEQGISDATSSVGKQGIQSSEEHDWTYYTDYNGNVTKEDKDECEWIEEDVSGVDREMLSDTSVPILFFDEVFTHILFFLLLYYLLPSF